MLDTFILKSTNEKRDLRLMTLRCKGYSSMMLGRENHSEKQKELSLNPGSVSTKFCDLTLVSFTKLRFAPL